MAKADQNKSRINDRLGIKRTQEGLFIVSGGQRAIHENPTTGLHLDVFYEKLDFCHAILWEGRLEVDSPTIPLAELLLEKNANRSDQREGCHRYHYAPALSTHWRDSDKEVINIKRIAEICSNDWGFWRTVTMNLEKVRVLAQDILNSPVSKVLA